MNTKEFGQIIESKFVFECSKLGIRVSRPIGDTAPYDFIIEINNLLFRVQCKSFSKYKNKYTADVHKKTGHRRSIKKSYVGLVDLFFFYNVEDDIFAYLNIKDSPDTTVSFKIESRSSNSRLIKNHQSIYNACGLIQRSESDAHNVEDASSNLATATT